MSIKVGNINIFNIVIHFWMTSIQSELEYRFNIFVELISVLGNLLGSLFILSLFYSPETDLGGWSWNSAIIVLGMYNFLEGITTTFLQPNLSRIVKHIQNGTLDFVLLKPIDSQLWLSFRIFSPWGIPSIFSGVVLILIGLIYSNTLINFKFIFYSTIMISSSVTILYSMWFLIATTSIWFVRVWNANEVLRSTLVAGRYPITAYPESLRKVFTFIIPIAFLTTIPAQAMLNMITFRMLSLSALVASLTFFFARRFWIFSLRFYTSASS